MALQVVSLLPITGSEDEQCLLCQKIVKPKWTCISDIGKGCQQQERWKMHDEGKD